MYLSHLPAIKKLFARSGVSFAYFFGSRAEGRATASSDFYFAVYLREISPAKRDTRLELLGALETLFAPRHADLVVLNDIRSITLRYYSHY